MSTVHPAQSGANEGEAVRDRRTVLRGAAAVGLAGAAAPLLAACGDDGEAGGTPSSAPGTTSAPTTSAPTSAPSSAPSSAPGGGSVLGPTSDVPVGGGKVYQDAKVVVTQPKAGEFKGFSAVCTHNQCIVRDVANGTINCGCHGSKFAIADGARTAGPASSPLPPAKVTVQGNNILGPAT